MKTHTIITRAALLGLAVCMSLTAGAERRSVVLPAGTVLPLLLDQNLDSRTARAGDRFTATVRAGRGDADLPAGTRVEGTIREARHSGGGKPGVLDLDFRKITIPGAGAKELSAGLYSLEGRGVRRDPSGRLVASTDRAKDRLKLVGMGAGAGVVLSALTGGNTLQDAVLGAAAGLIVNEAGSKKPGDVHLKSGAAIGARLYREVRFTTTASIRQPIPPVDELYTDDRRTAEPSAAVGVMVDDREVRFGAAKPYRAGGTTMIPLDRVARAAGFETAWDPTSRTISARRGAVKLGVGSRVMFVAGERRRVLAGAEMRDGVIWAPQEFVAAAVEGSAEWDAASNTVLLTTRGR